MLTYCVCYIGDKLSKGIAYINGADLKEAYRQVSATPMIEKRSNSRMGPNRQTRELNGLPHLSALSEDKRWKECVPMEIRLKRTSGKFCVAGLFF